MASTTNQLTSSHRSAIRFGSAIACLLTTLLFLATASTIRAADAHVFAFELKGAGTPLGAFDDPCGIVTDRSGNIYVASATEDADSVTGRIDVFDPKGNFITEIKSEYRPCSLAVDSLGNLYVVEQRHEGEQNRGVVVYSPTVYEPSAGNITYDPEAKKIHRGGEGIAVDPLTDHVYITSPGATASIAEHDSVADGSGLLEVIDLNLKGDGCLSSVDIWGPGDSLYVSGCPGPTAYEPLKPRAYIVDRSTHEITKTLDGTTTPDESFGFVFGLTGLAVDQSSGDFYVGDILIHDVVNQFDSNGNFIFPLRDKRLIQANRSSDIAVDSPVRDPETGEVLGPSGYDSPNEGYVYVTSGRKASNSRVFAYAPVVKEPPVVQGERAEGITETEAVLEGEINPGGHETAYHFEYGTGDCEVEPCTSRPAGSAGSSASFKAVSASLTDLEPDTTYHFRLVASSHCNPADPEEVCTVASKDQTFTTYPVPSPSGSCPNAALRVGPSASLPGCRAYELVTPSDTNGRIPTAIPFGYSVGPNFAFPLASPDGRSVMFGTEGGSLPGSEANGYLDTYRAVRGESSWTTAITSPSAAQAKVVTPGGVAAEHDYAFWQVRGNKGDLPEGNYLRNLDGTFEPIGLGSLGEETGASGKWISADGDHIIFSTGEGANNFEEGAQQLEPEAAPTGTNAIYERSPDGPTHVVSLLPGEVPLKVDARYQGASADGTAVVFKVESTTYLRRNNSETIEVASGVTLFAGISANGERIFFLRPTGEISQAVVKGEAFAFDVLSEETTPIGGGEESIVVNVSADGSHVYFVSGQQLDGSEGTVDADNLYVWNGTGIEFITTLAHGDVIGEFSDGPGSVVVGGLGQWTGRSVQQSPTGTTGPADNPSRSIPSGDVFVFESRANLTPPFDSDGHRQVYRYDAEEGSLTCLSCNPTGIPASSNAQLESTSGRQGFESIPPVSALALIANVTDDGRRVFFQSDEALVTADSDGATDVYEWTEKGIGGCEREEGCVQLISSGRSASADYLYAMSPDGEEVFFLSSDLLVPQDQDATPSLYSARIEGGFPAPADAAIPCFADGCQGAPTPPPALADPVSSSFSDSGNALPDVKTRGRCGKGKRRVRRQGKVRCAKTKQKGSKQRRQGRAGR